MGMAKITASPITVQVQPLVKASSSKQVKVKFFNMLGIESSTTNTTINKSPTYNMESNKKFNHPRDANLVISSEKLKYNKQDDEALSFSPSLKHRWGSGSNLFQHHKASDDNNASMQNREDGLQSHKKKDGVSFVDTVKVLPIPKRDEYSDRVARRIWSSAVEIQEMAMRNSVEFAAEGWDWRTVTEDDQMYVCGDTGELVHPVHFGSNYM